MEFEGPSQKWQTSNSYITSAKKKEYLKWLKTLQSGGKCSVCGNVFNKNVALTIHSSFGSWKDATSVEWSSAQIQI